MGIAMMKLAHKQWDEDRDNDDWNSHNNVEDRTENVLLFTKWVKIESNWWLKYTEAHSQSDGIHKQITISINPSWRFNELKSNINP